MKLLEFALTGFYFYTTKLFIFIFIFASLIMVSCFAYTLYIIFAFFTGGMIEYPGWSTITILVLFFGSISLFIKFCITIFSYKKYLIFHLISQTI